MSEKSDDRTVHAALLNGVEVVRYDRSGKWYEESPGQRKRIGVEQAVDDALLAGANVWLDQPGGRAFDAKLRRKRGF